MTVSHLSVGILNDSNSLNLFFEGIKQFVDRWA